MSRRRLIFFSALIFSSISVLPAVRAQSPGTPWRVYPKQYPQETAVDRYMSSMGRLAYKKVHGPANGAQTGLHPEDATSTGICSPSDDCDSDQPSGGLAETSIAMDATGQHIVVGFNDFRGVFLSPVSLTGYMYSDDGGNTFTDGGELPVAATGQLIRAVGSLPAGTALPSMHGDPDVKYVPGGNGCQFVFSSIMFQGFGTAPNYTSITPTMGIFRSTDCGHTWTGPFEVMPASNPSGALIQGNPGDTADKELMDVDPDTGLVLMSWTNFNANGALEISTTYSADAMTADTPSWSLRVVLNQASELSLATGSVPRFLGHGSGLTWVAWKGYGTAPFFEVESDIYVATSYDQGADFANVVKVNRGPIIRLDNILGNDRQPLFPSMAVDTSNGQYQGNLYIVYASNNSGDGADVVFQESVDGGNTFSDPIFLNSNPGLDGAQWFPYVTVDSTTGRVSVVYYDQGISTGGDLTELMWTYSDDGGATWSRPSPLSPRPFHSGYGNDLNLPNLGDYINAIASGGTLYAAYATTPSQASFTDGQAQTNGFFFPYPNAVVQKGVKAQLALSLGTVTFTDSGGNGYIDPGELIHFQLPLRSYAVNPSVSPQNFTGVSATLSTATPGVTVTKATISYGTINVGATVSNPQDFLVQIAPSFLPGTKIEFLLAVSNASGTVTLPFTQVTGTPVVTQIFAEDFESVAPGSLPAAWTALHGGPRVPSRGAPPPGYIVPWTTDNSFCGASSNGLFHVNADDGPANLQDNTRWEIAVSPPILVPLESEYVTLDFDICYDTEDDPELPITDYDGAILRIADLSPGRTNRVVLAEAFPDSFVTGSTPFYPKHFPQNENPSYIVNGAVSNWGGYSNGFQHVSMRLPGMAGSIIVLYFDYTQDQNLTCADLRFYDSCGVIIDNIVMNSVVSGVQAHDVTSAAQASPASPAGP